MKVSDISRRLTVLCALLVICSVLLSGCGLLRKLFRGSSQTDYPYYCTAKKWFPYIEYKAKLWRPSVVFYGINDTEVNMDGEARKWEYYFDSPEANKQATILLQGGFISLKEESHSVLSSVKNWQVDSSAAILKANEAGGSTFLAQEPKAKIYISLVTEVPNTRQKRGVWFVKYQGSSSMLYVLIDIASGAVVSSQLINAQSQ